MIIHTFEVSAIHNEMYYFDIQCTEYIILIIIIVQNSHDIVQEAQDLELADEPMKHAFQ